MSFRSRLPEHIPSGAWLIIAATLAWWAPSIAVHQARIMAARVRFGVEMIAVDVLAALGRKRAARRVLAGVVRRMRRREQEAARRMLERR